MSSMEILERFNSASRDTIDNNPKVRKRAINELLGIFYDAPELKVSIESKLMQLQGDADEGVAKYATRILQKVQSGQRYRPTYGPTTYQPTPRRTSSGTTQSTAQDPKQVKNIVANIVCCVVMIIIYFIISYVAF